MSQGLITDMQATPEIIRQFDPACVADWAAAIHKTKKLFLTGEGSSRILPAHHVMTRAWQMGCDWHIRTTGARQAMDYDWRDWFVLAGTNSGRTREVIDFFTHLGAQAIPCHAVTATPHSLITQIATQTHYLSCGTEHAIAATKSVIEQTLVYQALLRGPEWDHQRQAADMCQAILASPVPPQMTDLLAASPCVYIAGRHDGIAEELALKACEILRTKTLYLDGTHVLHGVEEVMQPGETVILIDPFPADFTAIQTALIAGAGVNVIAISHHDTPFPTWHVPRLMGFDAYGLMMAGWRMLVAAGLAKGHDLDRAKRARKAGNAVA